TRRSRGVLIALRQGKWGEIQRRIEIRIAEDRHVAHLAASVEIEPCQAAIARSRYRLALAALQSLDLKHPFRTALVAGENPRTGKARIAPRRLRSHPDGVGTEVNLKSHRQVVDCCANPDRARQQPQPRCQSNVLGHGDTDIQTWPRGTRGDYVFRGSG